MNLEDYIKDLAPELQEKARACGSVEELIALAKEEKVPLPDDALAAIAGGDDIEPASCGHPECPKCKSEDTEQTGKNASYVFWKCRTCGYQWKVDILI